MCNGIIHNLNEVYRAPNSIGDVVVNWCLDCGAVVGDVEYDGRVKPGAAFKMKFPNCSAGNLVDSFKPEELTTHFSNLELCEHLCDTSQVIYQVKDEYGNQTATLQYFKRNKQWNIYVDNFPSNKMEYSTTLPIQNLNQFKFDIERTGVKLISIKQH